jgi:hypothetical protein
MRCAASLALHQVRGIEYVASLALGQRVFIMEP